jgi:hypothetical protein
VTDALLPPFTVRVNVPPAAPLPESGTAAGELMSELVTVSVPGREPTAAGVNVTVTEQLPPAASVATVHGPVIA